MRKHAFAIGLWILTFAMGGFLFYHEVMVKGKTLYLKESIVLLLVAFACIAGVYALLKKGVPIVVIKLIILMVCVIAFFVLTWLGL